MVVRPIQGEGVRDSCLRERTERLGHRTLPAAGPAEGYKLAENDFKATVDGLDDVKTAKCPSQILRPSRPAPIPQAESTPGPENAQDSILKASGIFGGAREFAVGYRSIDDKNFNVSLRAFCVK